jgi:ABC-type dipeptide/oligopeptide/nickel transport system ATPase component
MKSGDVVEMGEAAQVFDAPAHSYTQSLLHAVISH